MIDQRHEGFGRRHRQCRSQDMPPVGDEYVVDNHECSFPLALDRQGAGHDLMSPTLPAGGGGAPHQPPAATRPG
jgi:hypothetical protein